MKESVEILAVVPARCGSKGLPGKNIRPLKNKPLLAWSVEAGLKSRFVTRTVVSSDCDEILEIAKRYGAIPLRRPKELASDHSPSEPLVRHALEYFDKRGERFDFVMLLQPTSPLRNSEDVDDAIRKLIESRGDSLISVYEPEHSPYKAFKIDERGYLVGLLGDETPFMRRQDLPPVYMPNGAIYIVAVDKFLESGKLHTATTLPYIMPREKSVDIDDLEDFKRAEKILEAME